MSSHGRDHGAVTGAFVTFFTRGAADNAQCRVRNAMDLAARQERRLGVTERAWTKASGLLSPAQWSALQEDPVPRTATSARGDADSAETVIPAR